MKKLVLVALVIILAGAGCTTTSTPESDSSPTLAVPAPGHDVDEMMVMEDGMMDGTDTDEEEQLLKENEERVEDDTTEKAPDQDTTAPLLQKMDSGNFFFAPDTLRVKAGQQVDITWATNDGFHTFVIDEIDFKRTVKEGDTISFTAPTAPGTYAYYCDIGRHRELGMEGILIVE